MPDLLEAAGLGGEGPAGGDARGTGAGAGAEGAARGLHGPVSRRVEFRVVGNPQSQGSARAFTPKGWSRAIITSDNPNLKQWRELVALHASNAMQTAPVLEGPVRLFAAFYVPRPKSLPKRETLPTKKPDVDKLLRALCDALTHVVWKDDSQVVDAHVRKVYAVNEPVGVHVVVEG